MTDTSIRGRFVWHELMSNDPDAAAAYFRTVFGWTTQPFGQTPGYRLFMSGAQGAGGLMLLPDQAKAHGTPPVWVTYIATPDIDDTVARAVALGGRILRAVQDIPTIGRVALLADPQGAMFAAITPLPRAGSLGRERHSWHELATTDPIAAIAFYHQLFGWEEAGASDMGPDLGTYQMFGFGGVPMGGMMKQSAQAPGPAAWLGYVRVDDVRTLAKKITGAGGTITHGPAEVPGGDWIVNAVDPEGVVFAAHSPKPAEKSAPAVRTAAKPKKKAVARKKAAVKKPAPKKVTAPKKSAPAKKSVEKKPSKAARKALAKKKR